MHLGIQTTMQAVLHTALYNWLGSTWLWPQQRQALQLLCIPFCLKSNCMDRQLLDMLLYAASCAKRAGFYSRVEIMSLSGVNVHWCILWWALCLCSRLLAARQQDVVRQLACVYVVMPTGCSASGLLLTALHAGPLPTGPWSMLLLAGVPGSSEALSAPEWLLPTAPVGSSSIGPIGCAVLTGLGSGASAVWAESRASCHVAFPADGTTCNELKSVDCCACCAEQALAISLQGPDVGS